TTASDHAASPFQLRPLGPGSPAENPSTSSTGAQAGAYVTFDARREPTVQIRVAISFVSIDNARQNLVAAIPTWSLDRVRDDTRPTWERLLDLIRVSGGSNQERRTFYTMLYHALLGPTVFSDTNGQYLGMDGEVHFAEGFTQYTTFSGWDIYRSQIALLAMLV